jgi:hypothetical protein
MSRMTADIGPGVRYNLAGGVVSLALAVGGQA